MAIFNSYVSLPEGSYRPGASHCRNRSMTRNPRVPELDEGETRQEAPNIWLKPGVEP